MFTLFILQKILSARVAFRKPSDETARLVRLLRHEWPQALLIGAMALLCVIGCWSDVRFAGVSQGLEWAIDTDASPTPE